MLAVPLQAFSMLCYVMFRLNELLNLRIIFIVSNSSYFKWFNSLCPTMIANRGAFTILDQDDRLLSPAQLAFSVSEKRVKRPSSSNSTFFSCKKAVSDCGRKSRCEIGKSHRENRKRSRNLVELSVRRLSSGDSTDRYIHR